MSLGDFLSYKARRFGDKGQQLYGCTAVLHFRAMVSRTSSSSHELSDVKLCSLMQR